MMLFGILVFMVVYFGTILQLIQQEQSSPYMDEVFHVPQVQHYCAHNFSHWDNMITTLPGLYLSSVLWTEPLKILTGLNFCTLPCLRLQNVFFTVICYVVIHYLFQKLHPKSPSYFLPLLLISFPLLFFFSFLYYTDVGSTLLVLLGYSLALRSCHLTSSLVLFVAVLFRQTNIVWAVFVAGIAGLKSVESKMTTKNGSSVLEQFLHLLNTVYSCLPLLVASLWSYCFLGVGFCIFVIINGGIVVGDKTHHVASLHFPQFLYFVSFTCLFSMGPILFSWKRFLCDIFKPKYLLTVIGLTFISLVLVHHYTYEHPYLLADNRHYTFYVWKDIFKSSYVNMKYYLTPLYSLGIVFLVTTLASEQSVLWVLLFILCSIVSLVPQALLEFRYYIIPYLLYRLHIRPIPVWGYVVELIYFNIINIVTLWLFIYHPFKWEGHQGFQRFMW